ncbi:MAG: ChbG/HpnK family deacetylase [bacterium]
MAELIIHADDYGLTSSVSQGILDAHAHGIVTSTSILMTHVTPKELAWAKAEPTLDFGIHLNLTSGPPLSGAAGVPHLVGERRVFAVPRSTVADDPHPRFDFSQVPETELRTELAAQVRAGLATGLTITHLDTHHHIARSPQVWEIVIDLASDHGLALRSLDAVQREDCLDAGVPTSHRFLGQWFGGGTGGVEGLLDATLALGEGPIGELMCHPGRESEILAAISSYSAERQAELTVLQDPAVRRALRERGVRLIGWGDLLEPANL